MPCMGFMGAERLHHVGEWVVLSEIPLSAASCLGPGADALRGQTGHPKGAFNRTSLYSCCLCGYMVLLRYVRSPVPGAAHGSALPFC